MKSPLAFLVLCITPILASAQSYDLSWFTIDGGGNISTGGAYSISGTIGQPDAGNLSGGSYSIAGGFWSFAADSGAPILAIQLALPNVLISWPAPSTGFVLEQTSSLSSPSWTVVDGSIVVVAGRNTVTLPVNATAQLFRLHGY